MKKLYGITSEVLDFQIIELALKSGLDMFQFRNKSLSSFDFVEIGIRLKGLCEIYKVDFIVNDRLEEAMKIGSKGIHLGEEEDFNFNKALDNFEIVGVSCYDSLSRASRFNNASYLAFGSCFASPTKPKSKVIDLNILKNINIDTEICVIGGITPNNLNLIPRFDIVSIVSSLWSGDIEQNIKEFKKLL